MEAVIEIVRSIRNARAQYNVEASKLIDANIYTTDLKPAITAYAQPIGRLAKANITVFDKKEEHKVENALALVLSEAEVVIPMESMLDLQAEKQRLKKETGQMQDEVNRLEKMLNDEAFLTKAPPAVVCKEKDKLSARRDSLKRLKKRFASLNPD
jgi:valyl-tRNA synthetase